MRHQIVIMDLSGVYKMESFYRHAYFDWIDCTALDGTQGYCDNHALTVLRHKIAPYAPDGIHFIDSGNYHYISKLWTDKITEPFALLLFDHHTDMQPSLFGKLLSCGSWVKDALDTNPYLKKVVIIGAADKLLEQIDPVYADRVISYKESELHDDTRWRHFALQHVPYPVYISIDKDVLTTEEAVSDWDNGSMTLAQLTVLLHRIVYNRRVIGVDICGGCSRTLQLITNPAALSLNDRANKLLLQKLYCALPRTT